MSSSNLLTREGNQIYAPNSGIRQAIPPKSLCKSCIHLGDLCKGFEKEYKKFDQFKVVIGCTRYEEQKL